MYSFVNTDEHIEKKILPAEAMQYDGIYLEDEIPGYRTLSVRGRELMPAEVKDEEIGLTNGSIFLGKRYSSRTIIVSYQLISESNMAFREAYNRMNLLLSGEQVQIIFADEPDKYFIGTKTGNTDPEPGKNSVTGEIEIYCSDPKKYSCVEKLFQASENEDGILECTISNNGTEEVPISYEITHGIHDNGYIGIVSDQGCVQFGYVEEADGEDYQQNEMLLTLDDFISAPDDIGGYDAMHPNYGTKGTLTVKNWFDTDFLTFGSKGESIGNANGGLRTITLPEDSEGEVGAKNWYTYFHLIFYAGLMGQTGEMSISWLTEDDKLIAGVNWNKTDTVGNTGYYDLVTYNPDYTGGDMKGRVLKTYSYQTHHLPSLNPWYWDWGHCDLRKEGSKLTFFYWGGYPSFYVPEIENMVCKKIQIACKQWKERDGNQFLTFMGFDIFNFQKLYVEKWRDIPNRYAAGDVVMIDGTTSKMYVNGMPRFGDEIIGSQYFKARPGNTDILFPVSTFCDPKPEIRARIREAWL